MWLIRRWFWLLCRAASTDHGLTDDQTPLSKSASRQRQFGSSIWMPWQRAMDAVEESEETACLKQRLQPARPSALPCWGAMLLYLYTRRLERRKARLERLNAQLREFYGPFYAIFEATRIAHIRFVSTLRPGSTTLFAPDVPPLNVGELRLWRLWAMSTHQHRSTPAYEVIINKAHLLIEDEMPQCLLDFCAHKARYDVVIERWKQGDYTEHLSAVRGLLGHGGAEVSGSRAVRPL
jgi:hypothetical protein